MKIGFVGLGSMGRTMAANLLKGGHELWVWNRSPSSVQPLVELGAFGANCRGSESGFRCQRRSLASGDRP
ncbi:NAD(P)-binding domain-containing protein [Pseudomonas sp. PD9R]|jgi:3-hydroxyisobutyrate dehydrogenase-like beta-hydroxyacid dehydrogenase|nr:NAD(P)-binding domain-containing protein [Pseudomonas sp. PD9R]